MNALKIAPSSLHAVRTAKLRFAPSPNGLLHLGHLASLVTNAKIARDLDAILLLRIEDIDTLRCTIENIRALEEDLNWLGFSFPTPILRQSQHFSRYRAAAADLEAQGLLYPCFCTRMEISRAVAKIEANTGAPHPRDPDGAPLYPQSCKDLSAAQRAARIKSGAAYALRLDMEQALRRIAEPMYWQEFSYPAFTATNILATPQKWGDVVLVRKETPTSYHLSVVLDDALQEITHIVRGEDLYEATHLHRLLQALFNLPTPHYHHHPLLRDETGDKLAKSRASKSIKAWRDEGMSAEALKVNINSAF